MMEQAAVLPTNAKTLIALPAQCQRLFALFAIRILNEIRIFNVLVHQII